MFEWFLSRNSIPEGYEKDVSDGEYKTVGTYNRSDGEKESKRSRFKVIEDEKLPAKMLLQIHDELIFEVDEAEAQTLGDKFKCIMEDIMELNIPLKASLNIGDKWSELK